MRAKAVIVFNVAVARWTMWQLFQILKEVFLFQRSLEGHIKRLFWTENQIEQQTREVEENDEKGRKDLGDNASASCFAIAIGPDDEDKPKRYEVRARERDQNLYTS